MAMITVARTGGLALMIGSALYIVSTLLAPGSFVNGADASSVYAMTDIIADNPLLTDFSSILGGVSLMFLLWGMIVMWQTAQSPCALDTFVKFGLAGVMLAVVCLFAAQCFIYATSHVVEHGVGLGAGADQTEALRAIGNHMQSMAGVARLMAGITGLMGYVVLGFALGRKFRPGVNRWLAFVVGVGAIVSLIGIILTEPFHELIDTLAPIFTVLSMLYLVWWIIIGYGVYTERLGLRIGVTPEH